MDSFEQLARLVQRLTRASGESPFIDFSATQASADVSHDDALGLFGSESPRKRRIRATLLSSESVSNSGFNVNPVFSSPFVQEGEPPKNAAGPAGFESTAAALVTLPQPGASVTPRKERGRSGTDLFFQKPSTPPAGRHSPSALSPLLRLGSSHSMTSPGDSFLAELLSAEVPIAAKLASSQVKDDMVPLSVHSSRSSSPGTPSPSSGARSPAAEAGSIAGGASSATPGRTYPAPRTLDFSPEALDGTAGSMASSASMHRERRGAMARLAALHTRTAPQGALYALLKTAAEALTLHPSAVLLPNGQQELLLEATEAHVWALHVLLQLTPVLRLLPSAILQSIAAHPCIRHMCAPLVQAVLRQAQAQDSAVVPFPTPAADGGVRVAHGFDASGRAVLTPRARFGSAAAVSPLQHSPPSPPSPAAPASVPGAGAGGAPRLVRSVSDAGTSASIGVAFDPDAAEESEVARHASISVQFVGAAEGTDPLSQSRHLHRTREATAALMNRTRVKDTIQGLVRSHATARSAFSSQSHTEYSQSFLAAAQDTVSSLPGANAPWFAGLLLGMLASVAPAGTDLTHADSAVASIGTSSDAARIAKLNERMADASPAQAAAAATAAGLQPIGKKQRPNGAAVRRSKGGAAALRGSGAGASAAAAVPGSSSRAPGGSKGRTKLVPVTAQHLQSLGAAPKGNLPQPQAAAVGGTVPSVAHWLGKESVMQGGRRVAGSVRFFQALAAATHGSQAGEVLQATTLRCIHSLGVLGQSVDLGMGRDGGEGVDGDAWCWGAQCAQSLAVACRDIPALQGAQTIMACASSARAAGGLLAVLHASALHAWSLCVQHSADAGEETPQEPVCMLGFPEMVLAAANSGSLCVLVPALLAYLRTGHHILALHDSDTSAAAPSIWQGATGNALRAVQGAVYERICDGHVLPVTRSHLAVWLELQSMPVKQGTTAPHYVTDAIHSSLQRPTRCGLDGTFAALGMLGLRNAFPDITAVHHKLSRLPLASKADTMPLGHRDRKDSSGSLGSGFGQRKKIRPVLVSAPGGTLSALSGIAEHGGVATGKVDSVKGGTGLAVFPPTSNGGKHGATKATHSGAEREAAHVLLSPVFQAKLVHGYLHRHSHVTAIGDSVAPTLALSCVKHSMAAVVESTCRSALKMFHEEIAAKLAKATATQGHGSPVTQLPASAVDGVWTLAVASAQKAAKTKVRAASERVFLAAIQVAVSTACAAPDSILAAASAGGSSKCTPPQWARGVASLCAAQEQGDADAAWAEAHIAGQVAARQSLSKLDNAIAQLVPVHTARRLAAERSTACKHYWLPKQAEG